MLMIGPETLRVFLTPLLALYSRSFRLEKHFESNIGRTSKSLLILIEEGQAQREELKNYLQMVGRDIYRYS